MGPARMLFGIFFDYAEGAFWTKRATIDGLTQLPKMASLVHVRDLVSYRFLWLKLGPITLR